MINEAIQIVLHIDQYINIVVQNFGAWSYVILFLVIFAETGLVVTPFLPGDSLLFAIGALAATGSLDPVLLVIVLAAAAVLGDTANYAVGKYLGHALFEKLHSRFLKKEYLDKTHRFYEKYGAKTIVIARFVPIVRTFAPFVAGIGTMSYLKFAAYNVVGGILWVLLFVLAGYFFGNIPMVKNNFTLVIFAIIFVSLLPGIVEYLRHSCSKQKEKPAE